jgi:bifunctional non-homologous end joining protein LigD
MARDLRPSPGVDAQDQPFSRLLTRQIDGFFLSDFEQGEFGPDLFRHACLGLEGMVSKHCESAYRGGR